LVSNIHDDADVDIDADLVVVYDGAPHTNSFSVFPAFARWSVAYTNTSGEVADAPTEVGVWTAVLTVESSDAVTGGTFVFPSSLVIEIPVAPPDVSDLSSAPSYTTAALSGVVVPNRAAPLSVLFEYGTTSKYGNKILALDSPVSGFVPVHVSVAISGLLPNPTYHWRILAGDTVSSGKTFTTGPLPVPALSVAAATDTSLRIAWPAIDGATNYLLSAYFLSDSGASHVYSFSDWDSHASSSTPYTQETEEGLWTLADASVAPENDAPATGDGSMGAVSLTKNGATLKSPTFDSLTSVRFIAASKSGSQSLTLQVSTNAGRTFRDINTWTIPTKPGTWRTNVWSSSLPEGSIVRFRNDGTKAILLHDLVVDEANAAPAALPGFPRSLPPGTTDCLISELAPSTVYHFSVLAQGPSWQTDPSPDLATSTLAPDANPPAFVPWTSTPSVSIGSTLSTNITASNSVSILLSTATASGPFSFDNGIFTYTPVPADVGPQTFTFVAQNQHGTVTNDYTVEVLPIPDLPAFIPWDSTPAVTVGNTLATNISATDAFS
ncbi:MAG: hypothetical protein J6Y19_04350, partial [Kiritimatiellae bacterium]|nr:hypothetical protein [Kiritimatiellia bacterium]